MATTDEIERLSRRRYEVWATGMPSDGEVTRITVRLADLYETKRAEAAHIPGVRRADVVRQARVESELERLITGRR